MIEDIFERELNKESVFKNRDVLSPHYIPDSLPYREKYIKEISKTLAPILSGKKPENIFIYGKPGTGKTVVTKYVLKRLEDFAEKKNVPVKGIYVNCRIHNTKCRVFVKVLESLETSEDFRGLSASYIYDLVLRKVDNSGTRTVIVLDEVDRLKGVDDTVYALNRSNDDLVNGSISLVGISNNVMFKDRIDPRTKSTLCEKEMVFPPYNAEELKKILSDRAAEGFCDGCIEDSAITLAAALSANRSGDARYGLLLLLRAGEVADEEGSRVVREEHVKKALKIVEEDVILDLVSTLPEQERICILAIARMFSENKGIKVLGGDTLVTTGDAYSYYSSLSERMGKKPVSDRWFRSYISELEMYGLITTAQSSKGMRGQTRIIKLNFDCEKIIESLEKSLGI